MRFLAFLALYCLCSLPVAAQTRFSATQLREDLAALEAAIRDTHPDLQHSTWMRFNVAVCERDDVLQRLERLFADFGGAKATTREEDGLAQMAVC